MYMCVVCYMTCRYTTNFKYYILLENIIKMFHYISKIVKVKYNIMVYQLSGLIRISNDKILNIIIYGIFLSKNIYDE